MWKQTREHCTAHHTTSWFATRRMCPWETLSWRQRKHLMSISYGRRKKKRTTKDFSLASKVVADAVDKVLQKYDSPPAIYGFRQCASNECKCGWFSVWCKNGGAGRLANGLAINCCLSRDCNRLSASWVSDANAAPPLSKFDPLLLLLLLWLLLLLLLLLLFNCCRLSASLLLLLIGDGACGWCGGWMCCCCCGWWLLFTWNPWLCSCEWWWMKLCCK